MIITSRNFIHHYCVIIPPKSLRRNINAKIKSKRRLWGELLVDKMLRYTLRVDRELFGKFRYIAESKGRSANKEIEQYIKRLVREFEEKNGKIDLTDKA